MTRQELIQQIKQKRSFLCVGLDTDPKKMPNAEIKFGHIVDHFFSFVLSWASGAQNFFQFIVLLSSMVRVPFLSCAQHSRLR